MATQRGSGWPADHEHVVDDEIIDVVVRRSPRYGRFLGLGIVAGILIAASLTAVLGFSDEPGGAISTGASGVLRVFGVYAAIFVGIGLVVMGSLAVILDRLALKRAISARAHHNITLVMDLDSPVNDDVPRWVRDSEDLT